MFTAVIGWLLNTRRGQGVVLAMTVVLTAFIALKYAEHNGYEKCKTEEVGAVGKANVDLHESEAKRDKAGSDIAKGASASAAAAVRETDDFTGTSKGIIHEIYNAPPKTAPVVFGSCVHPLDQRVQDRIDAAVNQANAARGPM